MRKLLIIAGGTGGHIFPATVVADELKKQGVLIEWMGTEAGMERQLIASRYPLHFLPVKTFRGKSWSTKLTAPFKLLYAVLLAYRMIKKINPDVVLGMGGYASGPGGVASWLLRKPLVIHEQNAKVGLTNRWLSRIAKKILQAFPGAFPKNSNATTVGNPVRSSIQQITRADNYFRLQKPFHILVLGGSQGAHAINQLMTNYVAQLSDQESCLIWHQTGKNDFEFVKKNYQHAKVIHHVAPFIEKMDEAYAWADIVICRAGALTVSELAAAGLPSILIPYPFAADDHQYANARFLEQACAGIVFRESELTVEKLSACLNDLFSSSERLQSMAKQAKLCAQPDAVAKIVAALFSDPCQ